MLLVLLVGRQFAAFPLLPYRQTAELTAQRVGGELLPRKSGLFFNSSLYEYLLF